MKKGKYFSCSSLKNEITRSGAGIQKEQVFIQKPASETWSEMGNSNIYLKTLEFENIK
jgi:hypothetical protein